jgi:hypothetical protein
MGFLRNLFSPPKGPDARSYYLYLECDQCGEKLKTRVDLHSDLSIEYGKSRKGDTFHVRKQVVGENLCFRRIEIQLTFDRNRSLIHKEASGGKFITEREYLEAGPTE